MAILFDLSMVLEVADFLMKVYVTIARNPGIYPMEIIIIKGDEFEKQKATDKAG